MNEILQVTLPVFLVIGAGYLAVWRNVFSDEGVDSLMTFTQNFAIPCLLFRAISTLDIEEVFNPGVIFSYYSGSLVCFVVGILGARFVFSRPMPDAVAIGFCCLFANTVLLGLPIMERAHGVAAQQPMFAIIAFHTPFCYLLGITTMEVVRNSETGVLRTITSILKTMMRNALVIAILLGFAVNFSGLALPAVGTEAIDLVARAGLPAALFGLGGVLCRYRPEGDMKEITFICLVSLLLHPAVAWVVGRGAFDMPDEMFRAAVLTAAMAPGVNSYIFANMYGVAKRVAASSVLLGTGFSILTTSMWLSALP